MKPLPIKQELFSYEYIVDFNATKAAIRAGYSKKTAASQGERLLRNVEIQSRIREHIEERQKTTGITADKVVNELARIAFFDVGVLYNEDGTLKEIAQLDSEVTRAIHSTKQRIEKQGQDKEDWAEIKEIRTHDKLKALELLGKHLAMFTDKHEHSGTLSLKDFVEQRKQ